MDTRKSSQPAAGGSNRNSRSTNSRKKSRKSRQLSPVRKFVTIVLLALIIVAGMSMFFKVETIRTEGNQKYSNYAIAEASGIQSGNNLMTLKKSEIASLIMQQLPYINAVIITRELPDSVVITVSEGDAAAAVIDADNNYWHISETGKVLEKIESIEDETVVIITGVNLVEPVAGAQLTLADDEDKSKASQMLLLINTLSKYGILFDVSEIDMSKSFNPVLSYLGRFKVELGVTDELDYKIKYLLAVVEEEQTKDQTGTIDLTFDSDKNVHFRPDKSN